MPDKAIDLIDEAASRVRLYRATSPANLREALHDLDLLHKEKESAIQTEDYSRAQELLERERRLRDRISQMEAGWSEERIEEKPFVTEEDIAQIVSMWTGIPLMRIAGEESERLLQMEDALHKRVVGQEEAISTLAKAVRRARAGLKDPKRPIGSYIFLGPTGVGKTELAKALAEFMFGSEDALIKIDMSEFMERHNVARLVGAPPGYVGYEEGGQLTEAVRRKSYSVILLDEIEKAHPEAFNMLLQIMEDGNLADAKGRRVDFRNTIIIMTSNVGADVINRDLSIGFASRNDAEKTQKREYELMKDKVVNELKKTFKPEFINRLDGVIVFHSLTNDEIRRIADLLLNRLRKQMQEQDITLDVSDEAMDLLAKRGYDPTFGARPLRRIIQNLIEDPLAEGMLESRFQAGGAIGVSVENELLKLDNLAQPAEEGGEAVAEPPAKAKRKPKADKEAAGVASGGEDEPEPVA
jgi:ATP-dependent Clp protease ATP-binding subunit ClpC